MHTEAANVTRLGGGVAVKPVVYWHRQRAFAELGLME
jgi:hypothetical protein